MPTGPMDSNAQSKHSRGRTACKQCRQAKVKCGMETTPCARCQRRGYECEWDPGFKRSNNPDRFQHLEGHLRTLERKLGSTASHSPSSAHSKTVRHNSPTSDSQVAPPGHIADPNGDARLEHSPRSNDTDNSPEDSDDFKVLDVKLSRHDATDLFALYFEKYHHYYPMLDQSKDLDAYFESSELLFWTIISIAGRTSPPERDFLARLSPFLTTAVGRTLLGESIRLPTIQAVLLLALWPSYNVSWWTDRSYVLSNFAVTAGTYLGLQSPFFEHEYTDLDVEWNQDDREARTRTWICCLIVANTISIEFGYVTRLAFDERTISSICNGSSLVQIPKDLQHHLIIQRLGYLAHEAISRTVISDAMDRDEIALSAILEKYDTELIELRQPDWSLSNRFRLLAMRLFIQCMYFHFNTANPTRKPGIFKAVSIAQDLINLVMAEDSDSEVLIHSPRTTMRMLGIAAQTIFKVVHSSYGIELNHEVEQMVYNSACLCIHQQSLQSRWKDQPRRTRDILQELWKIGENDPEMCAREPMLTIKTRLGASLIYDCLAIWRHGQRGERVNFGHHKASSTSPNHANLPDPVPPMPGFGDMPMDMGDFDNLVSDYLALPWDPNYNNGEFLY